MSDGGVVMKDHRTWWRVVIEDYQRMDWKATDDWPLEVSECPDDEDCVIEQCWAIREGLA